MSLSSELPESVPWFTPQMTGGELGFLEDVVASNYLNEGDVTREFEHQLAGRVGARHCAAVTSGTVAIALSLLATGVGPGDEVIVPDLTFIATANAARLIGAEVILVDVEPLRFTIDVAEVETALSERTRAVIAVDVNGRACDYERLKALCDKRGIALICDSTEGLGSKSGGRFLGTHGQAGCFSFSAAKTITTGQGGAVVTDDEGLYERILELKDQGRRERGTGGNDLHPVLGFNFKFTNLQAGVGLAQLQDLDRRLDQARSRDRWYEERFEGFPGVRIPAAPALKGEVTQWTDGLFEEQERVAAALEAAGLGVRPFWYPLHTQAPYRTDRDFPNASAVSAKGLWLTSWFSLREEHVDRAATIVGRALEIEAPG